MAGLPDVDTFNGLGGHLVNAGPVEDPTTDLDAAFDNRMRMNVAAASHTGTRFFCLFTAAASTGAMALVSHDSMWGNTAPVAPALARTGAGVFTVTAPVTVTDEDGGSHTVALRAAAGQAQGSTPYDVQCSASANVITVNVFNSAGAANDAVGVTIFVWAV